MRVTKRYGALAAAAIGLVLSCSDTFLQAASTVAPLPQLPADVPINKGAGRGGWLIVKLHLENGVEFPCIVDTGSPGSLLPKSVEQGLGRRLGTRTFRTLGGPRETAHIYAAPKLYLDKTPLATAATIGTCNDPSGVLGMDCLCHYCIQLNFQTGKIRFLDPERADSTDLGKRFPLTSTRYTCIRHAPLLGQKTTTLLLDTGDPFDGMANPSVFKRAAAEENAQPIPLLKDGVPAGSAPGMACFPRCVWDDTTYTNLVLEPGRPNLLGLRFLARHTVTFNFPKRVIYLKVTTANPLSAEESQ